VISPVHFDASDAKLLVNTSPFMAVTPGSSSIFSGLRAIAVT
jgi:hypothetical protein